MKVKCIRCHGKGFSIDPAGYSVADRKQCPRCEGTGEHEPCESIYPKKQKRIHKRYPRYEGLERLRFMEGV